MLTTKSIAQINVTDDSLSRIQNNTAAAVNPVLNVPILDGTLVQNLTIPASGKLTVAHGLGRQAIGYIIIKASAALPNPYVLVADQTAPNGAIVLTFASGAGTTLSAWVF